MPTFLDTRGNHTLSIAVCDRCRMKREYDDLGPDGNAPGLRVCSHGCRDEMDPWRLPAPAPDDITLAYPRPDAPLELPTLLLEEGEDPNPDSFLLTQEGGPLIIGNN